MTIIKIDNPTIEQVKAIPLHYTNLCAKSMSIEAVKALPAHIKILDVGNISLDAIKAIPLHVTSFGKLNFTLDVVKALPVHITCIGAPNFSIEVVKSLPGHVTYITTGNINIDAVKALPYHILRLKAKVDDVTANSIKAILRTRVGFTFINNHQLTELNEYMLSNPTAEQVKAIPLCFKQLTTIYISIEAIRNIPPHISALKVGEISVDAVKVIPAHVSLLQAQNFTMDTIKALPMHIRGLVTGNISLDLVKALPAQIQGFYCAVSSELENAFKEIFKTRPGFDFHNNGKHIALNPAAATTAPRLQVVAPVTLPAPTQTPAFAALQAENERLRKRLKAAENLATAQDEVIRTLREDLAQYEATDNNKRAKIG